MTRQEFLEELRIALQGELNQGRINEHLQYYDNFIMEEARKGRTEQQITEELGSPRLIARTLIDTASAGEKSYSGSDYSENYTEGRSDYGQRQQGQTSGGFQADYDQENGWDVRYGKFKLNSWYGRLLLILAAVLIIVVIANVVAFLLPIVIPVVLVLLVVSLIFGSRR